MNIVEDLSKVGRKPRRRLRFPGPFKAASVLLAVLLAALILSPVIGVFWQLIGQGPEVLLASVNRTLFEQDLGPVLWNTATIVAASAVLSLLGGAFLAWINERTDARMGLAGNLPLLPFLLSPIAGAVGWVALFSPRSGIINTMIRDALEPLGIHLTEGPINIHSWGGLVVVYSVYMIPYAFVIMAAAFRSFDASLEEQSNVAGVGRLLTLWRVTLPALRPSMIGALLLITWFGLSLFSVPVILAPRAEIEVLTMRIVRLVSFSFPPDIQAAVILSVLDLLIIAALWVLMRRSLRSHRSLVQGGRSARNGLVRLGRWRWPARAVVFGYVLIAAVLPLAALVHIGLTGFWSAQIDPSKWSLQYFQENLFSNRLTQEALSNSVGLAVAAATVGIMLAAIVAVYVRRSKSRFSYAVDGTIKLPATMPNIVLAIGFVLVFAGPPFGLHGTLLILFIAYLALYMPLASTAADSSAGLVGNDLVEASGLAGASSGRTFLRINLPLMLAGLVTGWAMLFARIVGDLNASAILSGSQNIVVGFRILELYTGSGSWSVLATLAVALTFVSTIVLVVFLSIARVVSRRTGATPASPQRAKKSTTVSKEFIK